jgi:hypothetical protein
MVQWAVHKLKQRWRWGWSCEQFKNWNRGGAIGWSREQFTNWKRDGATDSPESSSKTKTKVALQMVHRAVPNLKQRCHAADGPASSSQTETEVALWMVQWAVHKLKKRWRYVRSREQILSWNKGGAMHGPVSSSQTETEVALRMVKLTIDWNRGGAKDEWPGGQNTN